METEYIHIKDKKYEKIDNEDGSITLIYFTKEGIKVTLKFSNDIDKHNEAMKALSEFYYRTG